MIQESIYIPLENSAKLHLKRMYHSSSKEAVLLIHGSIENGKIFYSNSGKGLAPFLAKNGFDVFVLDLQGRGQSLPKVSKKMNYGQRDAILTDIPKSIEKINEICPDAKLYAIGHSWGGVLLLSYVARFGNPFKRIAFFGTKRRIAVRNKDYYLKIVLGWYVLGRVSLFFWGFLNALKMGMGSDNEPKKQYLQISNWLNSKSEWIDSEDGFDYQKKMLNDNFGPLLFLAGKKDTILGNPKDVKLLINELQASTSEYILLAKENGFLHDYDHINMLTHPDAPNDVFVQLTKWLLKGTPFSIRYF